MAGGIRSKALQRAAEIVGGRERLRELLGVPRRDFDAWLDGVAEPPLDIFFRAVDIISVVPEPLRDSRELRDKARIARERAAAARERAAAVCAAAIAGRLSSAARSAETLSALAFLQAKFEPLEGARMVRTALRAAVEATGADMGTLQIAQPEGLLLVGQHGFQAPFLDFFACVYDEGSACGAAKTSGQRVIVGDVATDPIFAGKEAGSVMLAANSRAVQSTPLIAPSGKLVGMLSTHYDRLWRPSERELDIVDHIARRAAFWLDGGAL